MALDRGVGSFLSFLISGVQILSCIYFVLLLNSLYLKDKFYLLSISPPLPAEGEGEG